MKLKVYISGASLLESVIAISIISGCLLVGLQVITSVNNVTTPKEFYAEKLNRVKALEAVTSSDSSSELESTESVTEQKPYGKLVELQVELAMGKTLKLWTFKTEQP